MGTPVSSLEFAEAVELELRRTFADSDGVEVRAAPGTAKLADQKDAFGLPGVALLDVEFEGGRHVTSYIPAIAGAAFQLGGRTVEILPETEDDGVQLILNYGHDEHPSGQDLENPLPEIVPGVAMDLPAPLALTGAGLWRIAGYLDFHNLQALLTGNVKLTAAIFNLGYATPSSIVPFTIRAGTRPDNAVIAEWTAAAAAILGVIPFAVDFEVPQAAIDAWNQILAAADTAGVGPTSPLPRSLATAMADPAAENWVPALGALGRNFKFTLLLDGTAGGNLVLKTALATLQRLGDL